MTDFSWQDHSACAGEDPNLFIPPDGETKAELPIRIRRAKAICGTCSVVKECLEFALRCDEIGIWGNTTGRERRRMRELAVSPEYQGPGRVTTHR
jgi:WhiB family redox-sensing transcriptional regulator